MNVMNYIWPVLIAIYIISPVDAHPLFMDDLIAAGVMFYMIWKNSKRRQQQQQSYHNSSQSHQNNNAESQGPLTLDKAYRLLGVTSDTSLDKINKAYREKMSKSHPDKVSHLSDELQETARELTLKLNEAYDLIKRHKG